MTHAVDVVSRALALGAEGHNATAVARALGLPRGTVRDWMYGKVPRHSRAVHGCAACGAIHDFAALPAAYVQLLGLYLGDGCISPHPRGVYKLRITLDARYPRVLEECEDAMAEVMPRSRLNRADYGIWLEVYSYSKGWPLPLSAARPREEA